MIDPYDVARRLGLDADGGVHRPVDGVPDARSAHPASYGRGSSARGTSRRDVLEVQSYLAMQGLGTTGTRPGIRSRRRRIDPEATMGNQESATLMDIRQIAAAHRESAIFVYRKHGRLHPKMWVESEKQVVLIEPSSWGACDVSDWQRVEMLTACVRSMDGTIIGRTDEVYIRDATKRSDRVMAEDLGLMVDFDPAIRSALMVHAYDMRTKETYMTMATFDLDNEGSPFWERHEMMQGYEMFAVPLWATAKQLRTLPRWPLSAFEADEYVNERFWITSRLDK